MTFSEKLTELRKNAGETQDMLGEALGVSGKTISKWESAATEPDLSMLTAIADHYKVSIDALFGREEPMTAFEHMKKEIRDSKDCGEFFQKVWRFSRGLIFSVWNAAEEYEHPQMAVPIDTLGPAGSEAFRSNYEGPTAALLNYYTGDIRMGVQVFRNPNSFAWIRDDREALAKLFALFGDPDTFAVLYVLNRADFSEDFTSVYLADHAGVTVEKAEFVLETMLTITGLTDTCHISRSTVETLEGERVIYNYIGDGALIGLLSLGKILLSGWGNNNCMSWNGVCKLIGEKGENA